MKGVQNINEYPEDREALMSFRGRIHRAIERIDQSASLSMLLTHSVFIR